MRFRNRLAATLIGMYDNSPTNLGPLVERDMHGRESITLFSRQYRHRARRKRLAYQLQRRERLRQVCKYGYKLLSHKPNVGIARLLDCMGSHSCVTRKSQTI